MVVVDLEKIRLPVSGPLPTVLAALSEPSLLLLDLLLTVQGTTMNATYFGGRVQLNLIKHLTVSRAAIPAYKEAPVRRLLFPTFADRRTIG